MGILRICDVAGWRHASRSERHLLFGDPDDAGPIGTRGAIPAEHEASWITLDEEKGRLVFGPEEKIEVYQGRDADLPRQLQQKLGLRGIHGWLFQVRDSGPNAQPRSFARLAGKEIMLSKLPYSQNYFVRRTLKPCKHERSIWDRVARAWDAHPEIKLADDRLDRLLRDLSMTPFISSKGCQAAWALSPKRFRVLGRPRSESGADYTVAALAMPFKQAYQILLSDRAVQDALEATETGVLFAHDKVGSEVKRTARTENPVRGPVRRYITEQLHAHRHQLMEAACWAALCGKNSAFASNLVGRTAARIYHDFAYNFTHREHRKDRVPRPYISLRDPGRVPVPASQDADEAQDYEAAWKRLTPAAAAPKVRELIKYVLGVRPERIGNEFVRSLRPPLAAWPREWEKPEGLSQALKRMDQFAE